MSRFALKAIIRRVPPIKRILDERAEYFKTLSDLKLEKLELINERDNLVNEINRYKENEIELLKEIDRLNTFEKQIPYGFKNPVNSSEFWENNYKKGLTSGTGSYAHLAEFKAEIVNKFITEENIQKVIEFGCGDGNQLSLMNYKDYVGVDVSPTIVNKNKHNFKNDLNKKFYTLDEKDIYMKQKYDLAVSLDVIFHLTEDEVYKKYMNDLFDASGKYVIIYSSNHEEFTRWAEFRNRKFMKYIQDYFYEWTLKKFIPNKFPFLFGEDETSTSNSDFYIFEKIIV